MNISTKSKYALRALVDLAAHYNGRPVLLKDIARRENLSLRYLENIFTRLRRDGLLNSSKGRGGGFFLARDPADITLLEIVTYLEGDTAVSHCVDELSACTRAGVCIARGVWVNLNKIYTEYLESVTLNSLVKEYLEQADAAPAGVQK
jgi:Rrf2 family protein